eukprot:TRINITY_DN13952_c0_g1_i1.p1 TRINITY_DN13952_c0_g1~~TRINITY_DN13952_c0_g1_i1.p1  ORF type:complete len:287 (-),score=21.04 TRINITY_DN13952_c0_g1_i1:19-879(-)
MRAIATIILALVACAICQNFPSSSQTWKNQGSNERVINITGTDPLKYSIGHVDLSIQITQGSGVLFYGVGDYKYNLTAGDSMITYETVVPFCTLDNGSNNGMSFYVFLESETDLSYEITLTQFSSELPNNETRAVNVVPSLFKRIPFFIPAGDKDVSKKISISVTSGVNLDSYMDVAVVEATQQCAAAADQLQSFPVPANTTTWTFEADFDAGYENYTVKFTPREKGTVFSSFYVTANVHLGPKPGLGNWLYLIIGGAGVVLIVAIIAVVLYVRRPKGYSQIQTSY